MFLNFILWLCEKLGRKQALVNFYGQVHLYRHYLTPWNQHEKGWKKYLPNIFINVYPGLFLDGDDEHGHPWNTWSIVLRGSYTEQINHKRTRVNLPYTVARLTPKDSHRIASVTPNTTTLFIHGWFQNDWRMFSAKHKVICNFCTEKNGGVCLKREGVFGLWEYLLQGIEGNEGGSLSQARSLAWIMVDDKFHKTIEKRKKAVERFNLKVPNNLEELMEANRNFVHEQHLKKIAKGVTHESNP